MAVECQKCQTENPADSKFCKKCATPLPKSKGVEHTKTAAPPPKEFTKGNMFADRYEIIEELGRGGMGVVYKAEDTKLKRTVALKFLPPNLTHSPDVKDRLMREAQAAASLDHPNICTVYEFDEAEGKSFISMAYVEGQSLRKKLESDSLELDEAIRIALQVAQGLQIAHKKGVVHRDIKSANIMVTEDNQAKIMDFGLARMPEGTLLTQKGTAMGTIAYMSPEQAQGEKVDHRTDIWSFGVVLYEMFGGQLPFKGEKDQAVVHFILHNDPKPVTSLRSGIPLEMDRIIAKCLEKAVEARYQTVTDLIIDLKRLSRDLSSGKTSISSVMEAKIRREARVSRNRILAGVGLFVIILLLVLIPSSRRGLKKILGLGTSKELRVAVLPFTTLAEPEENKVFCEGLISNVTGQLYRLPLIQENLWIVPIREVRKHNISTAKDAIRILGVDWTVGGSVNCRGNMVHVSMRATDTKTLNSITEDVTDHIANIAVFQQDLISKLVTMLALELKPEDLAVLTDGQSANPDSFGFYLKGLGYLKDYKKDTNLDKAIQMFDRASMQDSTYVLAYAMKGEAYQLKFFLTEEKKWIQDAETICNHAIRLNDKLPVTHRILGVIYERQERKEDAVKNYWKALELNPYHYNTYLNLGRILEDMGRIEDAENVFLLAAETFPHYWTPYFELGCLYLYYNSRYTESEKMLKKAIALMPENPVFLSTLGGVYLRMGRYGLAGQAFEKSMSIKPNPWAFNNLGVAYFYQRRYADAMSKFTEAIALDSSYYLFQGNLADTYRYIPEYKEMVPEAYLRAIQLAEENLEKSPGDAVCRAYLAFYYAFAGNYKKALAEIMEAEKLQPMNTEVLERSVYVYELVGQRKRAVAALEKLIKEGSSIEIIARDPDLTGLQADSRYKELVEEQ